MGRLPAVNPKPVGGGGEEQDSYEQLLGRSCPRCYIVMSYVKATGNYKCLSCGYEPENPEQQQKTEKQEEDEDI
jgi:hypothetical protein